jgi:D-3-phosphoglycerate dehydrogenase
MKSGKWDRKSFEGVEVYSKTLGVIGLGRIGAEVARRAVVFGMRVLAYDPFLSVHRAKSLEVELAELDEIYARADFITVHVPFTEETKGLIGTEQFKKMKKGVRIINCARGGIVDEKALAEAIKSGQVAGAALDVYEKEPPPADYALRDLPQVIMTPHLGASTSEAQESVGIEIAEAVSELLIEGTIRNAVNVPNVDAQPWAMLAACFQRLKPSMGWKPNVPQSHSGLTQLTCKSGSSTPEVWSLPPFFSSAWRILRTSSWTWRCDSTFTL